MVDRCDGGRDGNETAVRCGADVDLTPAAEASSDEGIGAEDIRRKRVVLPAHRGVNDWRSAPVLESRKARWRWTTELSLTSLVLDPLACTSEAWIDVGHHSGADGRSFAFALDGRGTVDQRRILREERNGSVRCRGHRDPFGVRHMGRKESLTLGESLERC